MAEYRRGSPAQFGADRKYVQQELAQLERTLQGLAENAGLTTTVAVPCGTLTFTSGVLTNKGTC